MDNELVETVLALCEALDDSGITPSVAMIRAKYTRPLSLQQAIKILQLYQSGERPTVSPPADKNPVKSHKQTATLADLSARLQQLEDANRHLLKRVDELEKRLLAITSRQGTE